MRAFFNAIAIIIVIDTGKRRSSSINTMLTRNGLGMLDVIITMTFGSCSPLLSAVLTLARLQPDYNPAETIIIVELECSVINSILLENRLSTIGARIES